jgi:hypothetical protein
MRSNSSKKNKLKTSNKMIGCCNKRTKTLTDLERNQARHVELQTVMHIGQRTSTRKKKKTKNKQQSNLEVEKQIPTRMPKSLLIEDKLRKFTGHRLGQVENPSNLNSKNKN